MKQHLFAAVAAVVAIAVLGFPGPSAEAREESCTELAENTASALVDQYCEAVKDADADRVVILPAPKFNAPVYMAPTAEGYSGKLQRQCTRTHSLICKQRMADMVGDDRRCVRLLHEGFDFEIKDEFGGAPIRTDSLSYYKTLQLEGCHLH